MLDILFEDMGPKSKCPALSQDGTVCGQKVIALGLCSAHYQASYREKKGITRKRHSPRFYDTSALYTRVSKRTDAMLSYLVEQSGETRSRYDVAREWLEEKAASLPSPPEEFLQRYEKHRLMPQNVGGKALARRSDDDTDDDLS